MARSTRKDENGVDPIRRRLLAGAPLAGAAALAGGRAAAGEPDEDDRADPRRTVYRETDHVKAYYARARG